MLKLLIVDDEKLDREGLQRQLPWIDYDIGSIHTATDGFEALELMEREKPDIILTDVKMPGMSGIELAEKARERLPDVKIVFVSGYDDFDFIKSAIRLNANEYILKPVKTKELASTIRTVADTIRAARKASEEKEILINAVNRSKPILRKKLLEDLVFGSIENQDFWEKINQLEVGIFPGNHTVLLVEIDDYKLLKGSMPDQELTRRRMLLEELAAELCKPGKNIELLQVSEQRFSLIASFPSSLLPEEIYEEAGTLAGNIIRAANETGGIGVSVGIGRITNSIHELYNSYDSAGRALLKKVYTGKGKVLVDEIELAPLPVEPKIDNIDEELSKCLVTCDLSRANHLLDSLFDRFEKEKISDSQYVQNYCINIISRMQISLLELNMKVDDIFGSAMLLWDKLMKFETIMDIRQWMKNVYRAVIEHIESNHDTRSSRIVEEVVSFIKENYGKAITLKDIAEKLFYTPNHLGSIFKERTGQSFSEYLTEYRIRKAAELLKDPIFKTYEVACMVGYNAMPAFIKQFKAVFHVTPTEYRERCK